MLALEGVDVLYGKAQALHGVSFAVGRDEVASIIGRNGAGKTTALKAAIGLLRCARGRRMLGGADATAWPPHRLSRAGVGYVPETRRIFANLSVRENLAMGAVAHAPGFWNFGRVSELFPFLGERADAPGDALSGGEQQMLVLCRALLGNPRLLIVDEPTEGLSPQMVERVAQTLAQLKSEGLALLLVEQKLDIALELADEVLVLGRGEAVFTGSVGALRERPELIDTWIGLA